MLKFNNNHIFTGYLKQLLSESYLPTCRVYTQEYRKYLEQYGKESPEVLETVTTRTNLAYGGSQYFFPYIKEGYVSRYIYTEDDSSTTALDATGTKAWSNVTSYAPGRKLPNRSKKLKITNNIYDSYTHEYLGNYLRFLRDYYLLDLMPLYNCFSNTMCTNAYIEYEYDSTSSVSKKKTSFLFDSSDERYKIYMVPIKLFKEYTIAIDSCTQVELCCGIYGKYRYSGNISVLTNLPVHTYQKLGSMKFNQPVLFTACKDLCDNLAESDRAALLELAKHEGDLKLFIKLPVHNSSSITILEGNYLGYNDRYLTHAAKVVTVNEDETIWPEIEYKNHVVTNFFDEDTQNIITAEDFMRSRTFKPITYLQLLAVNTGASYPFADKLMEYLSENVITHLDPIADNIERAQAVVKVYTGGQVMADYGVWDERLRPIIYQYMQTYTGKEGVTQAINHDVFGYIDKSAEAVFKAKTGVTTTTTASGKTKTKPVYTSISEMDIYSDEYELSKDE